MSPSPSFAHQLALTRLLVLLDSAMPADCVVLAAPFDWVLWEHPRLQVRQPDIIVVRRTELLGTHLASAPLLAVEVLSPTSADRDAVHKRDEYAGAGLDHYWIVDPIEPRMLVFRRAGASLVLAAQAAGNEELRLTEPFDVTVTPALLLG